MAERASKDRRPAAVDNPFLAMQEAVSKQIVASLDAWREMTENSERANVSVGLRLACVAGRRGH